jgi:hypothetical protein
MHADFRVGALNRGINGVASTEMWGEFEVKNLTSSLEVVSLTAYRYNGQEIAFFNQKLEGYEKHIFKVEQLSSSMMSADGRINDNDVKAAALIQSSTSRLEIRVRQLRLYGDQIETSDFGALSPIDPMARALYGRELQLMGDHNFIIFNTTSTERTSLFCQGTRDGRCTSGSWSVRLPPFGSKKISRQDISPDLGPFLIMNMGAGVAPLEYVGVDSTSSTFNVKSGITFGDTIKDQ